MTPTKKTCIRCSLEKDLSEFYRHPAMADGHLGKCKECCRREAAKNRRNNQERYDQYDRDRVNNPERKKSRKDFRDKQKEESPEKIAARYAVSNAIKSGRLKSESCSVCGKENAHAHHEDYNKPLDVIWLCHAHHMERHRKY